MLCVCKKDWVNVFQSQSVRNWLVQTFSSSCCIALFHHKSLQRVENWDFTSQCKPSLRAWISPTGFSLGRTTFFVASHLCEKWMSVMQNQCQNAIHHLPSHNCCWVAFLFLAQNDPALNDLVQISWFGPHSDLLVCAESFLRNFVRNLKSWKWKKNTHSNSVDFRAKFFWVEFSCVQLTLAMTQNI